MPVTQSLKRGFPKGHLIVNSEAVHDKEHTVQDPKDTSSVEPPLAWLAGHK